MMRDILEYLFNFNKLDYNQSKKILIDINSNRYSHAEISSFITAYKMRNPSIEEMEGFRDALLELCVKINLNEYNTIDLCGTGGDGKDTFNISTISSFVVAGAGFKVTKHGNYGVSSNCGSSNVLEFLGIKFSAEVILDLYEEKDNGLINFKLIKGDFRRFEGSWKIKGINDSKKNSLFYDLTVKGCQWMPIGMIEKRLKRDLSENLIAVDKQARIHSIKI